jgi:16S rRNA processing protein RimM
MTPGSSHISSRLCAAVVASAHGVRGHVKIKCFLEDPSHLKDYSPFLNEQGETTYKVDKILSQDKDVLIVSLENITDRNQAELLKGAKLMLSRDKLPELSENTFYHSDLIGLSVKSSQNKELGKVHALYNFGAGEILEIKTLQGTLHMVPFTKEAVPEINVSEGFIFLSPEGEDFLKGGTTDES